MLKIIFSIMVGLFLSTPVTAQTNLPVTSQELVVLAQQDQSHPETILLTTYKLAQIEPPYEIWAKKSPKLANVKPVDLDNIYSQELMRLKVGYDTLKQSDVLSVHTKINFAQNYSDLRGILIIPSFDNRTFFRFTAYDENVAIIPNNIAQFNTLNIDKTVLDKLRETKQNLETVTAEILIRPKQVDIKTPFVDNGVSYYLLSGDIAELRLWSSDPTAPTLIWRYQADWYKLGLNKDLMELK